ncbi:MAG TPA: hypothetical protein VGK65_07755 [Candidatus Binatia bacterium]
MPAIEIFEEFIPKLDPIFFAGIRKLILLDNDYHKDKKVTAAAGMFQSKALNPPTSNFI